MNTLMCEAACCQGASGLKRSMKSTARCSRESSGAAGGANQISCARVGRTNMKAVNIMPTAPVTARIFLFIGLTRSARNGQYIARSSTRRKAQNAFSRAQPGNPDHPSQVRRGGEEGQERDSGPLTESESQAH